MAKNEKVAETPEATPEKKKRGVAKGTKRPSKYSTFKVKFEKSIEGLDPIAALKALGDSLGAHVSEQISKNRAGVETGGMTLVIASTVQAKRAKSVIGKDKEKIALDAFRAILRNPEKKALADALVERSNSGEDTSKEMAALLGLSE